MNIKLNQNISKIYHQLDSQVADIQSQRSKHPRAHSSQQREQLKTIASQLQTLQNELYAKEKKQVNDATAISTQSQNIPPTEEEIPLDKLNTLANTVHQLIDETPIFFQASGESKSTIRKIIHSIYAALENVLEKCSFGFVFPKGPKDLLLDECFDGAAHNAYHKKLPGLIRHNEEQLEKIYNEIQEQKGVGPEKLEEEVQALKNTNPGKYSKVLLLRHNIEKLKKEIKIVQKYQRKGDEMRAYCVAIGGSRIEIQTEDHVKLDGMYLDAQSFRRTLKQTGCSLTTFTTKGDGQTSPRQVQAVTMPKESYYNSNAGGKIVLALNQLDGIQDTSEGSTTPGAGWTLVEDDENIYFIRSEELPEQGQQHPLFSYHGASETWKLKENLANVERSAPLPIDDTSPASGTVIISSGGTGVYEAHKAESLLFLFSNMNVVLFNFRGYGASEGNATEHGFKLDMEAAYQFAKSQSGHEDKKLLFKALCMSGGPAAHAAANHPDTNIFLDQTSADFSKLVGEMAQIKLEVELEKFANESGLKEKVVALVKPLIGKVTSKFIRLIAPDFNVAKKLSKNRGQKAIFFTHNDNSIHFEHVEKNIKAVAKAGQMHKLTVISGPGEHASSVLKVASSPVDYLQSPAKMREYDDLLFYYNLMDEEKNRLEMKRSRLEHRPEKKEALAACIAQIKHLEEKMESIRTQAERIEKETEDLIALQAPQIGPNATKVEFTAQNQIRHFLTKAELSNDIIKKDSQLRHPSSPPLYYLNTESEL